MAIALAALVAAVAAALITTVLLLQSGTTVAPASVVDDSPRLGVSEDVLGGQRFGSADSLERQAAQPGSGGASGHVVP